MKKTLFILAGLAFLAFSSCTEDVEVIPDMSNRSNLKTVEVGIPADVCNETGFTLIAGQHINVGTVTLANDGENLYVNYETDGVWLIQEIHFYIGALADVPTNKKGVPVPGHFPYNMEGLNVTSVTFSIPLSELELGDGCPLDFLHVLAHAVVEKVNDDGNVQNETAWGDGGCNFEDTFGITRWGFCGEYCFEECEEVTKYLTFKTLAIDISSGQEFWTILRDGTRLYPETSAWCKELGVVVPMNGDTYELVIEGIPFAVAEIIIENDQLIVRLTSNDENIEFTNTYVFYGTLSRLDEFGYCPNYTRFPYQDNEQGTAHEIITSLH